MATVLSIQNLSKNYSGVRALNNVSFEVPAGTVYGILGPNGSGKTTLLGIVMDILKATAGTYSWNGELATDQVRKRIGTLLETPNFYHYLSGEDNLKIAARIKGKGEERIDEVLKTVNLYERRGSKFNTYSLGMKQRLAIASTLLGDPDILVFDEPTNGLDPAGIAEIRQLIKSLSSKGKTIIMASHILDEVEKVCTHVAIIQKGVLKAAGSVKEVMNTGQSADAGTALIEQVELAADDMRQLEIVLQALGGIGRIEKGEHELLVNFSPQLSAAAINKYCYENGVVLTKLNTRKKSLETRFLEITGQQSDR